MIKLIRTSRLSITLSLSLGRQNASELTGMADRTVAMLSEAQGASLSADPALKVCILSLSLLALSSSSIFSCFLYLFSQPRSLSLLALSISSISSCSLYLFSHPFSISSCSSSSLLSLLASHHLSCFGLCFSETVLWQSTGWAPVPDAAEPSTLKIAHSAGAMYTGTSLISNCTPSLGPP